MVAEFSNDKRMIIINVTRYKPIIDANTNFAYALLFIVNDQQKQQLTS